MTLILLSECRLALKRFLPFLLAFVLPLLLIYVWWGGFNGVSIQEAVRGPYTYVYQEHVGDYAKLTDVQMEVRKRLAMQNVPPGLAITVLESNPDLVSKAERRGRAGYLVPEGTQVAEPLKLATIPARPVLLAQVRAGILLAPSKAYLALDRYLRSQNMGMVMPTVEIYESSDSLWAMGLMSVEMSLP